MRRQAAEAPLAGRGERIVVTASLWGLALLTVMPLVFILLKALEPAPGTEGDFLGIFTFENFERAWERGRFSVALRNSFIVSGVVTLLVTVLSTLAGYALAILRQPGSRAFTVLFVLGLIIPFEALIIPLFFQLRDFGLTDTRWSLILPQSALSLAFGVYWMRVFFLGVPTSLLEAARVEGASHARILVQVTLPLAPPALLTLVIICFMWNWNEFLIPLVMVQDTGLATAPLGLALFKSQFLVDVTGQAASGIIIATPILVLYVILNKRVLAGFTRSSVTGAER